MKSFPVATNMLPTGRQIAVLLLAIAVVLTGLGFLCCEAIGAPAHLPDPYVQSDTGTTRNSDSVRLLVVRNPRRDAVVVVVWCRKAPLSATSARIPARAAITFEMASDRELRAGDCEIARWRQAR